MVRFPTLKWAQREHNLILIIPTANFKYTKLQLANDKLWFIGVDKNGEIYEIDHEFLNLVDI